MNMLSNGRRAAEEDGRNLGCSSTTYDCDSYFSKLKSQLLNVEFSMNPAEKKCLRIEGKLQQDWMMKRKWEHEIACD